MSKAKETMPKRIVKNLIDSMSTQQRVYVNRDKSKRLSGRPHEIVKRKRGKYRETPGTVGGSTEWLTDTGYLIHIEVIVEKFEPAAAPSTTGIDKV